MSQNITGVIIKRQFERHNVNTVKRRSRYFIGLPRYKRLLMILTDGKLFSRLEVGAGLIPYHTDPRTGIPTEKGKEALDRTIRTLNKNGYKEKYPMAKVYSLPYVDENSVSEQGIATARYYLVLIHGKSIAQVIKNMKRVVSGIERSIGALEDLKSIREKKVVRELEKYRKQIEFDVQMARQQSQGRSRSGAGVS